MRKEEGKVGCGCLFFLFLLFLVVFGILFHPKTLRFIGGQLIYRDKILFSDVLYVPRFSEDSDGELYLAAFEELKKGNGRWIWVEDYELLQTSVVNILRRLAKERGVKEDLIKGIRLNGKESEKWKKLIELCKKERIRRVVVFVPEYSSRRYHIMLTGRSNGEVVFLINPVKLAFFNQERWWKESKSREAILKEYVEIISLYSEKFKYGRQKESRS